jgi:hypothetical protein
VWNHVWQKQKESPSPTDSVTHLNPVQGLSWCAAHQELQKMEREPQNSYRNLGGGKEEYVNSIGKPQLTPLVTINNHVIFMRKRRYASMSRPTS